MKRLCILTISLILIAKGTSEAPLKQQEYRKERKTEQVIDSQSEYLIRNDILLLHPAFRNKVLDLLYLCHKEGIELSIQETYRTSTRQDYLEKKRPRVTNLRGGESRHQYGLAIDVVPIVNGKPKWNDKKLWNRIGMIGESLGLAWGGRWRRPHDPGHFEWKCTTEDLLAGNLPSPPDTIKVLYNHW